MLGERLAHCKDAAACTEGVGARTGGECVIEPLKADSREYDIAASQGFERRIEFGSQIHAPGNAAKLEHFDTH
jgi:hypothetical protein